MSTRTDRNYRSWDGGGDDPPTHDVTLDPVADGWALGSWQDTAKFYARVGMQFADITVIRGGTEDGVDINDGCNHNRFDRFTVGPGDNNILTLKGGSSDNTFTGWHITRHGPNVDIEIGNWSSYNTSRSKRNQFIGWTAADGKPITCQYRLGCRPTFTGMNVKINHLMCVGLTIYWWFKYVKHRVLGVPDV